jgi:hypothetical protein
VRSDGYMETGSDSNVVSPFAGKSIRENILTLENHLRKMPQVEILPRHYFAHGTYTREVHLPAGSIITGKIHKHSCINMLMKGKIRVVTEEDDYDIEAPYVFVSGPGIKKAAHVIEDVIWLNVHPWNGTDTVEQIEDDVIIPSYENLIEQAEQTCLG